MLFQVKVVSQDEYDRRTWPTSRTAARTGSLPGRARPLDDSTRLTTRRPGSEDDDDHARVHAGNRLTGPRSGWPSRAPSGRAASSSSGSPSTDHKVIGNLYLISSFFFFLFGGIDGAGHPRSSCGQPGIQIVQCEGAVQPALHDARHDHAAAVRDTAVRRFRQRDHAAADRRARRRVPPAEHARLLAVPVRRADRVGRLPDPGRRRRFGWFAYAPLSNQIYSPGLGCRPVGHRAGAGRFRHDPRCRQLHHHDHLHARAGHDDVPDADLHLERADHLAAGADGVPAAGGRAAGAGGRPHGSARRSSTPTTAARSCGSTCSGSSAIPRSTSSRCRSSASSARSSRSSAASRSSATSRWCSRPSRSPRCR